jgi:hypothetical protein
MSTPGRAEHFHDGAHGKDSVGRRDDAIMSFNSPFDVAESLQNFYCALQSSLRQPRLVFGSDIPN